MLTAACRRAAWAAWTCKDAQAFSVQRRCEQRRDLSDKAPGGKLPGAFFLQRSRARVGRSRLQAPGKLCRAGDIVVQRNISPE
jgi:hypothetical protein